MTPTVHLACRYDVETRILVIMDYPNVDRMHDCKWQSLVGWDCGCQISVALDPEQPLHMYGLVWEHCQTCEFGIGFPELVSVPQQRKEFTRIFWTLTGEKLITRYAQQN